MEIRKVQIKTIDYYKQAWKVIKEQYWILFAVCLVGAVLASFFVLLGPMLCGIFICFLQAFEGKKVNFESLFKGFNYFLPSLLVVLISSIPLLLMIIAPFLMIAALSALGFELAETRGGVIFLGLLFVEFILALLMVSINTLLVFSFPLMVNEGLSALEAVLLSSKAVLKNLAGVVKITLVASLLSLIGQLACGVGVFFVLPLIFAVITLAYLKIFLAL
ncbi:MAG: hypothetical protein N2Z23_10975 [Pyrinomonadaceae bacterium]|nr:hypothetical protein [Pyrinomonadaceae bacterium]MCX7640948.1 hypothetical protein [Pyrinomonadaceae bacterium]MDW8304730.1 hypothetical protein [Acidobacteriota bacterium]